MKDSLRIPIIYNPVAGRRKFRRLRKVVEALEAKGFNPVVWETERSGDAERLARKVSVSNAYSIVAAGGDGTINEVVNGLDSEPPPFGVIPLGTANVFASEIGIPLSSEGVASVIAAGRTRRISLGAVNDRMFLQMASVGFDSHVVANVNLRIKRRVGRGAYILSAFRSLFSYGYPVLEGAVDDAPFDARWVVVCNGRLYGGRFVLAPDADPERESLEIILFPRPGAWNAFRYGVALRRTRILNLPDARHLAAPQITVDCPEGIPVHADGDVVSRTPAVIRVSETWLDVLAPSKSKQD